MAGMLDKFLRISVLLDFYGALLTDKQRHCLELHFMEDWSLAEIAAEFGVSRQAVYDIVHRSEQTLSDYEKKLGLAARYAREYETVREVYEMLDRLPEDLRGRSEIQDVINKLAEQVGKLEEI